MSPFGKSTNQNNPASPPGWAQKFLEWYCRPELLEDLHGDLNEYFLRHVKSKGIHRARIIYIIDVFKFMRSYTIRKPKFVNLLIQWIMLRSYIKTSGRSIVRNKLFSTINIVGLAISMSVGLLMIGLLTDLLSYDKFHENGSSIYRVNSTRTRVDQEPIKLASTSVRAGRKIQENVSGLKDVVIMRQGFGGDARVGENIVPVTGHYATESFFNVFSFKLLEGNPNTALKDPYSIILTEKTAKKLFGSEPAYGKSITFDTVDYVVTGILKDVPKFSHIQFETLVSFATMDIIGERDENYLRWQNIWINYVYVLLPENGKPTDLQHKLDILSAEENKALDNMAITLWLQPLNNIALGPDLSNQIGPTMTAAIVWVIGGLAFVVILSACFNYTNLSIARSLRRSREVGIRKVIGALKGHVVGQFISEAILISLMALVLAFGLFLLLRDEFMGIAPQLANLISLELSPRLILYFILLAVAVGFGAGLLPALFFARINAVQVLKDISSVKVFRNVTMRKALIVVQYTFSLMFIAATLIGYKQYKHFLAFDLGFNTANILNISLQGNNADLFVKELAEIPEVNSISKSRMITSVGNYWGTTMKYTNSQDSANIWYNTIDEHYLPLHQHKLIAGRNFTPKAGDEETEIIVNEKVIKRFMIGGGDPVKALGEVVTVDDKKMQIVGVMKDFHYGKADSEIEETAFRYSKNPGGHVNAKITSQDWPATLAKIERAWKKVDPIHPLEATFYTDQIEKAYSEFSAMIKIIGFLAFLAISISSMGLLGMVVFTTETRLKEISIRKVLGASEGNLIFLLSRGFLMLLLFSALVALPLTYLFFDQVVLSSMAYRAPIGLLELLGGLIVVMAIAMVMIGSQTLKVARTNPADVLKGE
jgi:putative ABC transport system permease protein